MIHGLPETKLAEIRAVFAQEPAVEKVYLFGSRALGRHQPGSDIDLAIAGPMVSFKTLLKLHVKLEESDGLYSYDLLNLRTTKDPDLLAHIERVGKLLYEKKV